MSFGVDKLLGGVDYLVEASRFEYTTLWVENKGIISWEEIPRGYLPLVGCINKRPINIALTGAEINNKKVVFWEPTSELVCHRLISEYFDSMGVYDSNRYSVERFENVLNEMGGGVNNDK